MNATALKTSKQIDFATEIPAEDDRRTLPDDNLPKDTPPS